MSHNCVYLSLPVCVHLYGRLNEKISNEIINKFWRDVTIELMAILGSIFLFLLTHYNKSIQTLFSLIHSLILFFTAVTNK
jgi:hypothetical protein